MRNDASLYIQNYILKKMINPTTKVSQIQSRKIEVGKKMTGGNKKDNKGQDNNNNFEELKRKNGTRKGKLPTKEERMIRNENQRINKATKGVNIITNKYADLEMKSTETEKAQEGAEKEMSMSTMEETKIRY